MSKREEELANTKRYDKELSKDLEKEIQKIDDKYPVEIQYIREIAHHFAEWQKKKDQETIELAEDHAMIAGIMKEREEIMKDAVDGYVSLCHDYPYRRSLVAIEDSLVNFEYAEKVKIIICKTEQQ